MLDMTPPYLSTRRAENTEDSIFYELTGLKKRVKSPGISMHTH